MTFFPEPLRPSEGREDDKYRVNPIEANKKGKENQHWEVPEEKERPKAYDAFLIFIQKKITFFEKNQDHGIEAISEDTLSNDLRELKTLLHVLIDCDQSENGSYCAQLSANWHRLLQGIQIFSHTKRKSFVDLSQTKSLIKDIGNYPANEDHNLGYYLSEFAGETWLPVPFREILKRLYVDYRVNQSYSVLMQWIGLINEILQS